MDPASETALQGNFPNPPVLYPPHQWQENADMEVLSDPVLAEKPSWARVLALTSPILL